MNWSEQTEFLSQINNPNIESILIVDNAGSGNFLNGETIDISDQEYFQEVISTQETAISTPMTSKTSGDKVIVIAVPIMDNNSLVGVLGGTVKSEYLQRLVADIAENLSASSEELSASGDAGRRFSVVADEIRQLAEESEDLTRMAVELTEVINKFNL